jgi:hypothetical protein
MTRQPPTLAANSLTQALLFGIVAMVIAGVCPAAENQVPCVADLYAFQKNGAASGRTEVTIVNGADRYRSVLLHAATALGELGFDRSWDLLLGDFNGDAVPDLYAIEKMGSRSGQTEVHILDGASLYRAYLVLGARSALRETGDDGTFMFSLGDYSGDGVPDLYAVEKQFTPSGQTEVHVLDGASFFGAHLLYTKTPLSELGSDFKWVLSTAGCTGAVIPDQGAY